MANYKIKSLEKALMGYFNETKGEYSDAFNGKIKYRDVKSSETRANTKSESFMTVVLDKWKNSSRVNYGSIPKKWDIHKFRTNIGEAYSAIKKCSTEKAHKAFNDLEVLRDISADENNFVVFNFKKEYAFAVSVRTVSTNNKKSVETVYWAVNPDRIHDIMDKYFHSVDSGKVVKEDKEKSSKEDSKNEKEVKASKEPVIKKEEVKSSEDSTAKKEKPSETTNVKNDKVEEKKKEEATPKMEEVKVSTDDKSVEKKKTSSPKEEEEKFLSKFINIDELPKMSNEVKEKVMLSITRFFMNNIILEKYPYMGAMSNKKYFFIPITIDSTTKDPIAFELRREIGNTGKFLYVRFNIQTEEASFDPGMCTDGKGGVFPIPSQK